VLGTLVLSYVHACIFLVLCTHINFSCIICIVCGSTRVYATASFAARSRDSTFIDRFIVVTGVQGLLERAGNYATKIIFFQSCENFVVYSTPRNNSEIFNACRFIYLVVFTNALFYILSNTFSLS